MLRLLLNSFGTKLISAFLSFISVLLTTHYLGLEGRGEVAVITASVNLIILLNTFLGSSALVYLTPKRNFYQLLIPSYIWVFLSSIIVHVLLTLFSSEIIHNNFFYGDANGELSSNLITHIILLALMGSLFEINMTILLGKEWIIGFNLIGVLRFAVLVSVLTWIFVFGEPSVLGFIKAMYFGYSAGLVLSWLAFFKFKTKIVLSGIKDAVLDVLNYGIQDQISVVLHFLNYRFATYALFYLSGKTDTGLFSVVMFLMEAVLMISNSFSLVQYSKVVNSEDRAYNHSLTMTLFKLTVVLLMLGCAFISLIPSGVFEFVIGKGFIGLNYYFALISPGLIAYGSTIFFNNYFCGIGKFYHNIVSNVLGLLVAVFGCWVIIPVYGIAGACIIVSCTYVVVGSYLLFKYMKEVDMRFSEIFISKKDVEEVRRLLNF